MRLQGELSGTALTSGVQSAALGAGALDPNTSYTLVFTVEDKVSSAEYYFTLNAESKELVIHHSYDGTNVCVGGTPSVTSGYSTRELPPGGKFMIGGVDLLSIIYPVGAVYRSTDSTYPGTLFGGTWTSLSTSPYYEWERTA